MGLTAAATVALCAVGLAAVAVATHRTLRGDPVGRVDYTCLAVGLGAVAALALIAWWPYQW